MSVSDLMKFAQLLGFTPAWFAAGVVDDAVLMRLRIEWEKGEDDNTEHYRHRAFRDFLASHRPLGPETARALFELGAGDPDQAMGGAIMADITRLPERSAIVLDAALASGCNHLIKIVKKSQGFTTN